MRVIGNTPDRVKKIYIQGSQEFSFHFDDSEGTPKDVIRFPVQGPSSVVDAATSSVARETAISFSPPPQRALPRPSNDPRKIKEKEAEFGDDDGDDDFVGVPPGPSASFSKATRVAAPKIKNSKPTLSGRKHSEATADINLSVSREVVRVNEEFTRNKHWSMEIYVRAAALSRSRSSNAGEFNSLMEDEK